MKHFEANPKGAQVNLFGDRGLRVKESSWSKLHDVLYKGYICRNAVVLARANAHPHKISFKNKSLRLYFVRGPTHLSMTLFYLETLYASIKIVFHSSLFYFL